MGNVVSVSNEPVTSADQAGAPAVPTRKVYKGSGSIPAVVCIFLLGLALVLLVAQNSDDVNFHYLWFDARVSLPLLLLATALASFVLDEVLGWVWRRRRRRLHNTREQLNELDRSRQA